MSRKYSPRRANKKRWLQDAPEYVLDCFDNGGKTADRYTIMFTGSLLIRHPEYSVEFKHTFIPYLGLSDNPTHPQGFSQWGELKAADAIGYREGVRRNERVRWLDLPEHIRQHIIERCKPETPRTPHRKAIGKLTLWEFTQHDRERAEEMAAKLSFRDHFAWNTTDDLPGLALLPRRNGDRDAGKIVNTDKFGLVFIQTLDDLGLSHLA